MTESNEPKKIDVYEVEYWLDDTDASYAEDVESSELTSYDEAKKRGSVRKLRVSRWSNQPPPTLEDFADKYQEDNMGTDSYDDEEVALITIRDPATGEQKSFFLRTEVTVEHDCDELAFTGGDDDEKPQPPDPNQLTLPL